MAALSELSKTKGFYRVTMDELAARAGLSKRTLYRYFPGKEAIIEAVIDYNLSRIGKEMDKILLSNCNPQEAFGQILNLFYREGRNLINPLVMQDLIAHYPQYWRKIDEYRMQKAQKVIKTLVGYDKDGARGLNPKIVTAIIMSSIQAVLNPEFILANNLTFEETVVQVIDFFKYGIIKDNKGGADG